VLSDIDSVLVGIEPRTHMRILYVYRAYYAMRSEAQGALH
jgi:hypothetical protein